MDGISALIRRDTGELICGHVRTQKEDGHLQTRKQTLTRT